MFLLYGGVERQISTQEPSVINSSERIPGIVCWNTSLSINNVTSIVKNLKRHNLTNIAWYDMFNIVDNTGVEF